MQENSNFELKNKNTILVKYTGDEEIVRVPDGVAVIHSCVFQDNKTIREVILPESIEIIGVEAFKNCSNLRKINLNSKIQIGPSAFKGCVKLSDENGFVILNDSLYDYVGGKDNPDIPVVETIDATAFEGSSVTTLTIPEGVKTILGNTEKMCDGLVNLSVASSVGPINIFTFGLYHKFERIYIENPFNVSNCHKPAAVRGFSEDLKKRSDKSKRLYSLLYRNVLLDEKSMRDESALTDILFENSSLIDVLADSGTINKENFDMLLEEAMNRGDTEFTACLLNLKHSGRLKDNCGVLGCSFDGNKASLPLKIYIDFRAEDKTLREKILNSGGTIVEKPMDAEIIVIRDRAISESEESYREAGFIVFQKSHLLNWL